MNADMGTFHDITHFTVYLKPDVALCTAFHHGPNCHKTDDERLAFLDRDVHLLSHRGAAKEVWGWDDADRRNIG